MCLLYLKSSSNFNLFCWCILQVRSLLKNINFFFFFFIFYISLTQVVKAKMGQEGWWLISHHTHTLFLMDFGMDTQLAELSETVQFVARIRELLVCLYSEQVLNSWQYMGVIAYVCDNASVKTRLSWRRHPLLLNRAQKALMSENTILFI